MTGVTEPPTPEKDEAGSILSNQNTKWAAGNEGSPADREIVIRGAARDWGSSG